MRPLDAVRQDLTTPLGLRQDREATRAESPSPGSRGEGPNRMRSISLTGG
jgi:hypothetical protein